MKTSWVEPGQIATRLPFRSFRVLIGAVLAGDDRHALVAGGPEHDDRFVGSGAQDAGGDAESAEIDGSGDDGGFAVGRAFERDDVELVARGQEAFVEPWRDRVDQLERAHFNVHRFSACRPISQDHWGRQSGRQQGAPRRDGIAKAFHGPLLLAVCSRLSRKSPIFWAPVRARIGIRTGVTGKARMGPKLLFARLRCDPRVQSARHGSRCE